MVFPWDVCYVVQFHWLHRDLFEMCNLHGALALASTGNDVILRHCACFRPFHELRGFRSFYLVDGKKLLSKFRTKSSVNTSITSRFHPTVVAALKLRASSKEKSLRLSYSRRYRIDLCSEIKPIAYCMALGYVLAQTI